MDTAYLKHPRAAYRHFRWVQSRRASGRLSRRDRRRQGRSAGQGVLRGNQSSDAGCDSPEPRSTPNRRQTDGMDTGLISEQDATVLLRLVIVLEGQLLAGGIDAELSRDLQRQFERVDLISESGAAAGVDRTDGMDHGDVGRAHLRLALANLNQRLRYALG